MISQGCTRIVHISGNQKRNVYKDRFEGYRKALEDSSIGFSEDLLIVGELTEDSGIEAAHNILKMKPLPDAIFSANDICAASCMQVLKQNGIRIPEDIAMTGFNNDPVSRLTEPNLTTVNYPAFRMGEIAATNLINHLQGVSSIFDTHKIILKSELLVRESSLKRK